MDLDLRGAVAGFLVAGVALAALVWVAGADAVLNAVGSLDARHALALAATATGWLLAWALALRTVLIALDIRVSVGSALLLFAASAFANNVTPLGQAGGEPFSALLVSRATGAPYERGLAAVASADAINFVPSILLALVGLGYSLASLTVGDGLRVVLVGVVGLAAGVPLIGYGVWSVRRRVQRLTVAALTPALRGVGRYVPRFTPPGREQVRRRVRGFVTALERVGTSRRSLAVALCLSTVGWAGMALVLWVALAAVGHPVPLTIALVAVPVGNVAGVTPLPGGLGGVEFALVLVVVPVAGVPTGAAAALVYRGATYWLPTVVGGVAAAWLEARPAAGG